MVTLSINGTDRSSLIRFGSLRISDRINQASDTCRFVIEQHGSQTFKPVVNDEVVVEVDAVRAYAGVVVTVEQSLEGHANIVYEVECKDYTQYMDRKLVTERYTDETLQDVVLDLIDRYADDYGFTGAAVGGADFEIASVSFSELPLSEVFNKLARLTGYSWYVDYYKDIHFFKKNDELAPFDLSDTSENYIYDSLVIKEDFSQIRNKVKIRGGEAEAEERTESYAGNGEQDTFPLGNKFASIPVVEVDGTPVTVGVDHIDDDADFDAMWSFQQTYIRFTTGNIPPEPTGPATTNVDVSGIPLKPIIVQRTNNQSIAQYGVYEFVKFNDSLKTRDEALQFAQAELDMYSDSINEGSFLTNTPGLRSGQTISIVSTLRDISEDFLIQSVEFVQQGFDLYQWKVEVATLRTIGMIDILQQLLLKERISEGEDETLLNFFQLEDSFYMNDDVGTITVTTTKNYLWEQGTPGSDTYTNPIVWNKFTWDT